QLLSTYYAATPLDLIADINAANAAGGANTIALTAPATSPYVLSTANNVTDGANGLPVISGRSKKLAADILTIIGNGYSMDANPHCYRIFDVANGGSLTLENLTLQNGYAYGSGVSAEGGAIYNQGTLVLNGAGVYGNAAVGASGGTVTKD